MKRLFGTSGMPQVSFGQFGLEKISVSLWLHRIAKEKKQENMRLRANTPVSKGMCIYVFYYP